MPRNGIVEPYIMPDNKIDDRGALEISHLRNNAADKVRDKCAGHDKINAAVYIFKKQSAIDEALPLEEEGDRKDKRERGGESDEEPEAQKVGFHGVCQSRAHKDDRRHQDHRMRQDGKDGHLGHSLWWPNHSATFENNVSSKKSRKQHDRQSDIEHEAQTFRADELFAVMGGICKIRTFEDDVGAHLQTWENNDVDHRDDKQCNDRDEKCP